MIVVPRSKEEEFVTSYEILEDLAAEKEEARARERAEQLAAEKERQEELAAERGEVRAEKLSAADKQQPKAASAEKRAAKDDNDNLNLDAEDKNKKEEKKAKSKPKQTCKNVVPRTAKKLADEPADEFVLYRIVVFKKGSDTLKNLCRERRYTVRAFAFDAEEEKDLGEKKALLLKQKRKLKNFFLTWSKTTFGEVFAAWIHLKAMRLFVEAVLRYGLPVNFLAYLLEPKKGHEKTLRAALGEAFKHLQPSNEQTKDAFDAIAGGDADLGGLSTAEYYPYVYVPIEFKD